MKKLFILFLLSTSLSNLSIGQNLLKTVSNDSSFIEVYINEKGIILLFEKKASLFQLESYFKKTELRNAKFATVFPTPLKVFAVVDKVQLLFDKYNIKSTWYKDSEFKTPAWE